MLSRKRCSNGRFLQPDSRAGASSKRSLLDRQNMMPYELSIGSKGEFVKNAQLRLIDLGYSCGRSGVDGQFGMDTYSAVIAFQRQNSLMPDGVIGEGTANVLYSKEAIRYSETSVLKKESVSLENFVNIALAECGIVEANDNITKYGEWYGMNGKPWCAMFVLIRQVYWHPLKIVMGLYLNMRLYTWGWNGIKIKIDLGKKENIDQNMVILFF